MIGDSYPSIKIDYYPNCSIENLKIGLKHTINRVLIDLAEAAKEEDDDDSNVDIGSSFQFSVLSEDKIKIFCHGMIWGNLKNMQLDQASRRADISIWAQNSERYSSSVPQELAYQIQNMCASYFKQLNIPFEFEIRNLAEKVIS